MRYSYSQPMRYISLMVLFFFIWSFGGLRDAAYAAKAATEPSPVPGQAKKAKRVDEKFDEALGDIVKQVGSMGKKKGADRDTARQNLKTKKQEIDILDAELLGQFSATEQMLKNKKLPEVILQRHADFVMDHKRNMKALRQHLDNIEAAATEEDENLAIEKADKFIKKARPSKKRVKLDPNNMPMSSPEPTQKKPRLKKEEFAPVQKAYLYNPSEAFALLVPGSSLEEDGFHPAAMNNNDLVRVAAVGSLSGLLDNASAGSEALLQSDLSLPSKNHDSVDQIILAQTTDLPASDDLAENIEVQFTPAIQAKAAELEHNPVKIYNWVRNNIEFVPTYGSIQGADYCLQSQYCNAYDTASLLIALLRASNIPARYVHGTIELPVEQAMNWTGDFTDATAALNFMRSGGIPVGGLIVGGKLAYAQMEHVWVEAWVDYMPSRGARHQTGKGDSWIPLDASFKQHTYTDGMDIASDVPFDAETFVDQLTSTATINESAGYVTDVDSLLIQQATTDYTVQVESYINDNFPDATVGDVLGTKETIEENFAYLLGTLPYKQLVAGSKQSTLSNTQRHKWSTSIQGEAPLSYSMTFPELAGKKITLSYSPATQADEDLIESYLPAPHPDGTPIDPSELPSSLPAYLIKLKPELRIDGQVVASGGAVQMGTLEDWFVTINSPGQPIRPVVNTLQAGDYVGVGLEMGRISQAHLEKIKTKLETTKAKLVAEDFTGLTKDDLLGDLLATTAVSYFAEYDALDYMAAKTMNVNTVRMPSEAHFYNNLKVTNSFWGTPMSASPGGLIMDVDYNLVVAMARDGSADTRLQFMRTSGLNSSALEHAVPEQLFSTPENTAEGVSAVKALQLANDQGIPIFTIDSSNLNSVLSQLNLDSDVITDIQTAVAYGKEVTVSQSNINFNGWTGCGYIVFDPVTGGGAYLISGGLSGAWFFAWFLSIVVTIFAVAFICALSGICAVVASTMFSVLKSTFALASSHINWLLAGVFSVLAKQPNKFNSCISKILAGHFMYHGGIHFLAKFIPNNFYFIITILVAQWSLAFWHGYELGHCTSSNH